MDKQGLSVGECIIFKSKCDTIIRKKPDKINWYWLSMNPNAIHLLEKNPEKIEWDYLSTQLNY